MSRIFITFALAVFLAGIGFARPASASLFCDLRPAASGSVALRQHPSAGSKLLARMRVGDEVMIFGGEARSRGFVHVRWWKGGRFKFRHDQGNDAPDADGWAFDRFIAADCG